MDAHTRERDGRGGQSDEVPDDASVPRVAAYGTSEDRVVFTEADNSDGWIATDLTVEPEP